MVSVLPRTHDQIHTIQIKLMRWMNYKTTYISKIIRPATVHEWAEHLIQQSLYVQHGITVTPDYLSQYPNASENVIVLEKDKQFLINNVDKVLPEDTWQVEDEPFCGQQISTRQLSLFLQREIGRPPSLLLDEDAEELSFLSIYFGQKQEVTNYISVRDFVKSELRRKDRHSTRSIANLFYKHM
jgi:hypothetical protein